MCVELKECTALFVALHTREEIVAWRNTSIEPTPPKRSISRWIQLASYRLQSGQALVKAAAGVSVCVYVRVCYLVSVASLFICFVICLCTLRDWWSSSRDIGSSFFFRSSSEIVQLCQPPVWGAIRIVYESTGAHLVKLLALLSCTRALCERVALAFNFILRERGERS